MPRVSDYQVQNYYVKNIHADENIRHNLRKPSDEISSTDLIISCVTQLAFKALSVAFECIAVYPIFKTSSKNAGSDFFNGVFSYETVMNSCLSAFLIKTMPVLDLYKTSLLGTEEELNKAKRQYENPSIPPWCGKDLKDYYLMLAAFTPEAYHTYCWERIKALALQSTLMGGFTYIVHRPEVPGSALISRCSWIIRIFFPLGDPKDSPLCRLGQFTAIYFISNIVLNAFRDVKIPNPL